MSLQTFIENLSDTVQTIEKSILTAWWELASTGDEKYAKAMEEGNVTLRKLFSSPENYQFLSEQPAPKDPLLARQRVLLLNQFKENQISAEMIEQITSLETEIEEIYTNFRATVNGQTLSNNDLKKILVESNDSKERQEAWEASKIIGEQVEAKVKKLILLRNAAAKKAGYRDFYSMRLELQEIDQQMLFKLLDDLYRLTDPAWKEYKAKLESSLVQRFKIPESEIMPWHYQDPFFQEAPSQNIDLDAFYKDKDIVGISNEYYSSVDLPIGDVLARSDLFERERKNQHAFCICIDRKQDVRILCNLRDNEYWMGTQLHELGHAVYDKYIDQKLPFLLRTPAHTSTTEAIAMLFGRLSKNGSFLQHFVGANEESVKEINGSLQKQSAANLLVFARWTLVMVHFEQAMYQKPDSDLNTLWWDCVEKYQYVKRVPDRNKPDWASKLHLACAPVYYQNYLLGEMTASQLLHSLDEKIKTEEKSDSISSKLIGNFLKTRLFAVGATYPWNETIRHVTGKELCPKYFANDVGKLKF